MDCVNAAIKWESNFLHNDLNEFKVDPLPEEKRITWSSAIDIIDLIVCCIAVNGTRLRHHFLYGKWRMNATPLTPLMLQFFFLRVFPQNQTL
jgi:hypothetical protein